MGQVAAQSCKDHNVVRTQCHGVGEGEEEWASEDRHDTSRGRQIKVAYRMADDWCALGYDDTLQGGVTQSQVALYRQ